MTLVKAKKETTGRMARMPRQQQSAILIHVRSNILVVQNIAHMVKLCLPGPMEAQIATLQWFLDQLHDDMRSLQIRVREENQISRGSQEPPTDAPVILQCLQRIRGHDHCKKVLYLHSRKCFRVVKKKEGHEDRRAEFFVRGIAKRKRGKSEALDLP